MSTFARSIVIPSLTVTGGSLLLGATGAFDWAPALAAAAIAASLAKVVSMRSHRAARLAEEESAQVLEFAAHQRRSNGGHHYDRAA